MAPNSGGTYVVDFCIDQAYTILNTGEPTRRSLTIQRGQLSAPDVTLARGCIGRRWQAKPDPESDHFFITFDIVIGDDEPLGSQVPKRSYYSWGRASREEFSVVHHYPRGMMTLVSKFIYHHEVRAPSQLTCCLAIAVPRDKVVVRINREVLLPCSALYFS